MEYRGSRAMLHFHRASFKFRVSGKDSNRLALVLRFTTVTSASKAWRLAALPGVPLGARRRNSMVYCCLRDKCIWPLQKAIRFQSLSRDRRLEMLGGASTSL